MNGWLILQFVLLLSTRQSTHTTTACIPFELLHSELHWLPTDYLLDWWKTTKWGRKLEDFVKNLIEYRFQNQGGGVHGEWKTDAKALELMNHQLPENMDCPFEKLTFRQYHKFYEKCVQPQEQWMDEVTKHVTGQDPLEYGAELIASIPVMRVTVLREPFSWLVSKFYWHDHHIMRNGSEVTADQAEPRNSMVTARLLKEGHAEVNIVKCDDIDTAVNGWLTNRAMTYIFYLCGEHCMGGYAKETMTLEDMERQAAYNLRNSFAVVGLLQKTDEFYDMVTRRVYYMNTYLNPDVGGDKHRSSNTREAMRCRKLFKDPEFKSKMMAKAPALAALYRLYQIAVEVNEFQEKELAECPAN